MKRSMILVLGIALFAPIGMMGCSEESKTVEKTTVSTPEGSVTKTDTSKVEKTGDMKEGEAK